MIKRIGYILYAWAILLSVPLLLIPLFFAKNMSDLVLPHCMAFLIFAGGYSFKYILTGEKSLWFYKAQD